MRGVREIDFSGGTDEHALPLAGESPRLRARENGRSRAASQSGIDLSDIPWWLVSFDSPSPEIVCLCRLPALPADRERPAYGKARPGRASVQPVAHARLKT